MRPGRPATPMYAEPTAADLCADGALDLDGAAEFCRISKREIERAVERGEIETMYHGRKPLVPKRVLVLWLAAKLEATRAERGGVTR